MMAMLIQGEIARAALNRRVTGLEQIGRVAGYLLPMSPGLDVQGLERVRELLEGREPLGRPRPA